MSMRRRKAMGQTEESDSFAEDKIIADQSLSEQKQWWRHLNGMQRWVIIGLIAFVSLGVLGAGLKYLEDSAREESARQKQNPLAKNESLLAGLNPFMPAPTPASTPQLSKEYIYAGSRMLAVEDAAASAIPPADLAVWRPSNGYWYCMGGVGSQAFTVAWGGVINGVPDLPVQGDYDGDGKTDLAILRPGATSVWWIYPSGGGFQSETARSDSPFSVSKNQTVYDIAKTFGFTENYQGNSQGRNTGLTGAKAIGGHNDHGHLGFDAGSRRVTYAQGTTVARGVFKPSFLKK